MPEHRSLKALSCDRPLLALWKKSSWHARVLSVHERALNLIDPGGTMVTLLTSTPYNGPSRILIEGPCSFAGIGIAPGDRFSCDGAELCHHTRKIVIALSPPPAMTVWSGRPDRRRSPLAGKGIKRNAARLARFLLARSGGETGDLVSESICRAGMSAVSSHRDALSPANELISALCDDLSKGIASGDPGQAQRAAQRLLGLGKGLTPTGDDILLGFLGGLSMMKYHGFALSATAVSFLRWFGSFIEGAGELTTLISCQFLRWAAQGRLSEELMDLTGELLESKEPDLEKRASWFLSMGASSGREILLGVALGMSAGGSGSIL
ncbi:MAG: DUF2877 domain-containing protein [Candidatus Eremiobacteraeota bacterium]|nr:DUF2877 domain-containing protein [Candidatus Eremiobacteraeota bacterium]